MLRSTLLLLILASICNNCISKPTSGITENTIADEGYDFRAQYAAQMLSYMNLSVQPCDEFYEYACGNWKNTIKERSTEKQRINFVDINFQLNDVVESLLQRSDMANVAPEYVREFELAKKFYHNCLESDLYPMHKSGEYLEIVQSIGGFPAVDDKWNASQFSWFNMSAHLNNYGADSLINEEVGDNYPFTPLFPLPTYGFDIELHYDTIGNTSSNAYQLNRNRMHTILSIYDVGEEKLDKIITDIFEFLMAVLGMVEQFDESQRKCEKMSKSLEDYVGDALVEQFVAYFDIAWMGKFEKVAHDHMPCVFFYHELNKICEEHKEAVANYLSIKFLYHMDARLEDPKFQKDYCTSEIKKSLHFLFDYAYMKVYFKRDIADDVTSMSRDIRQSMRELLQKADWLDEPTREAALLKESSMKVNVGRYEDRDTEEAILGEIKNLIFVENNYDANKINLKKFNIYIRRYYGLHQEEFSNHTKPLDCLQAMVANSFYYLTDNTMYITAGVLQPPVYHADWPRSLKFGALGFGLGHELGHGFDRHGGHFDHDGNRINWWSEEAIKKFYERLDCYVDHYNKYLVPEINRNVNGELTIDENVADATALLTAYMAYRRYVDVESNTFETASAFEKEEKMPGLDVSPDQLFFLGAAQLWCSDYKEAHYWTQLTDNHTVEKYRVLGMVANNKDFAKAFNCSVGDKMNATTDKCHIW